MAEKDPEREIRVEPRLPVLIDGLGYTFLNMGGMPDVERDGTEVIRFILQTDPLSRKRYNLRGGVEVDEQFNTKLTVKRIDVIELNPYDPANKKFLYVKDFRGNETNLSLRERDLKIENERLKKTILIQQASILKLREENSIAMLNPGKLLKMNNEVFQETLKNVSDSLLRKKEEH